MIRRSGFSCRGKDASVLILSALEELMSSCSSNIAGYAAKDFLGAAFYKFPQMLRRIFGGRRGGGRVFWVVHCLSLVGVVRWWDSGGWKLWGKGVASSDLLPQDCFFLHCCCDGDV